MKHEPKWSKERCLYLAEICWPARGGNEVAERAMWVWLLRWAGAPV